MPQSDLDEVTGHTADGVSRTARYLATFDVIVAAVRAGDHDGERSGWEALRPLWEALPEDERREIGHPMIRKFEELSAAYAVAPSPPGNRWEVGSPTIDVRRVVKLCESVAGGFDNYMNGAGFDAKQLAAEVPALVEQIRRLEAELAAVMKRVGRIGLMDQRLLVEGQAESARLRAELAISTRTETQVSISQWAEETFGPSGSNARAVARANREMSELLEHVTADDRHPEAAEEAADIMIVLYRVATRLGVDLHDLIDKKMAVNRVRKWRLDGTGHGYHVKGELTPVNSDEPEHPAMPYDRKWARRILDRAKADIDKAKDRDVSPPEPVPEEDWQARALAAETRCKQYEDALAEESGRLLARAAHVVPAPRQLANVGSEIRRSGWLAKIEALKPGDACEFHYPARKEWLPGVIVKNGSSGYWTVRDESKVEGRYGKDASCLYIEDIRLPGQEEAWR